MKMVQVVFLKWNRIREKLDTKSYVAVDKWFIVRDFERDPKMIHTYSTSTLQLEIPRMVVWKVRES